MLPVCLAFIAVTPVAVAPVTVVTVAVAQVSVAAVPVVAVLVAVDVVIVSAVTVTFVAFAPADAFSSVGVDVAAVGVDFVAVGVDVAAAAVDVAVTRFSSFASSLFSAFFVSSPVFPRIPFILFITLSVFYKRQNNAKSFL